MIVASNTLPAAASRPRAVATATLARAQRCRASRSSSPRSGRLYVRACSPAWFDRRHRVTGIKNTGFRTLIHQRVAAGAARPRLRRVQRRAQHGRARRPRRGRRRPRDDGGRPRHAVDRRRRLGVGGDRRGGRAGAARRAARGAGLGLAPAAERRPPSVKPRPNVPNANPPIATPLRHAESRCHRPRASRSSRVERLAATLLPQRASRAARRRGRRRSHSTARRPSRSLYSRPQLRPLAACTSPISISERETTRFPGTHWRD